MARADGKAFQIPAYVFRELRGGGVAPRRLLLQGLQDDIVQVAGKLANEHGLAVEYPGLALAGRARFRNRFLTDHALYLDWRVRRDAMRANACQQLVKNRAERVDIRRRC